jgi:hypothetical protein
MVRARLGRARPCVRESTVKHSRFPLLSLPLLLLGCSAGDLGGTPPTELDQSPPLNAQAPPLNPNSPPLSPNSPPCNGSISAEESVLLLAEAMCAQAQACTEAGSPVEVLGEVCGFYAICAANPADPDCEIDAVLPTLPICTAELTACLEAYLSELGCREPEALSIHQIPACSRVAAAFDQTDDTQVNTPDGDDVAAESDGG